MSDYVEPPAEVISATDIKAMAAEVLALVAAAEGHKAQGASNFRRAGKLLVKIKASLPHGEWGDFVEQNLNVSPRQASRWMLLAKSDAASDLDEQWAVICGHRDEPDATVTAGPGTPATPVQPPIESLFCREHRTGQKLPDRKCKDCADLRRERAGLRGVTEKPTPGTKPIKDGAVAWSLNEVVPFFGKALAGIGRLWIASGRCEGSAVKEDPEYLGLRRRIVELENDVRKMSRRMLRETGKNVQEDQNDG